MIKRCLKFSLIILAPLMIVKGSIASDLPNCVSSDYYYNCYGTHTYESGSKYVGEWRDNKFEGQGTFTHNNGDKYIGQWKDSKRNGQGTLIYNNGYTISGVWRNNKLINQTIPYELIALWYDQHNSCRGGFGDDPKTQEACNRRFEVTKKLNSIGWCYSEEHEASVQYEWQVCKANSFR